MDNHIFPDLAVDPAAKIRRFPAMKRMLDEIAAEGGFVSFVEGQEPYSDRDVQLAREAGLLIVRLAPGDSVDIHYMLTDKGREVYGLPPTLETQAANWVLDRVRWLWSSQDDDGNYRSSNGKLGFWLGFAGTAIVIAWLVA